MGIRGATVEVLAKPVDAAELDEFERLYPIQVESKNIRRTLMGGWRKSFGFATLADYSSAIVGLTIRDGMLFAFLKNGKVKRAPLDDPSAAVELGEVLSYASAPSTVMFGSRLLLATGNETYSIDNESVTRLGFTLDKGEVPPAPEVEIAFDEAWSTFNRYSGFHVVADGADRPISRSASYSGPAKIREGRYVYALRWVSPVGGLSAIGPMSGVVAIEKPDYAGISINIPTVEKDSVMGVQLLRAKLPIVASIVTGIDIAVGAFDFQWKVAAVFDNGNQFRYIDTAREEDLQDAEFTGSYALDPPRGVKYLAMIDDIVVAAGYSDTEFAWCNAGAVDWWPTDNRLNCQRDGGRIVGLKVIGRELYIFKTTNIEVWVNAGGEFQFQRRQVIDRGCAAPESIVFADNELYFLGDDGDFYVIRGGLPVIISIQETHDLVAMTNQAKCRGFDFRREKVIRWSFPDDGRCFVYDYVSEAWSEDAEYNGGHWEGRVYSAADCALGKQYAALEGDTTLYAIDEDTFSINTYRKVTVPLTGPYGHGGRVTRLRMRVKKLQTGSDFDNPSITVRWKFDRGEWTDTQYVSITGSESDPYVDFYNLGYGREITFEFQEGSSSSAHISNATISVLNLRR